MMQRLKNWISERLGREQVAPPAPNFRRTSAYIANRPAAGKAAHKKSENEPLELETHVGGRIEDAGPGKNVLIRSKYVREDTGTHETLKILDESLVESGEESGIDPYNTGGFDRSKNWNNRFRK